MTLLTSAYIQCWCKAELSLGVQSRNVSLLPSSPSARCVMLEPPSFGGSQGLWEEWDGLIVPRFPSDPSFPRRGPCAVLLDGSGILAVSTSSK